MMVSRVKLNLLTFVSIACLLFLAGCQSNGKQLNQTAFSSAKAENGVVVFASSYKTDATMLGLSRIQNYELLFSPYDSHNKDLVRDRFGAGSAMRARQTRGLFGYGKEIEKPFHHVVELKPGTYVFLSLETRWFGNRIVISCFANGSFAFQVKAGEAVYIGDFEFFTAKFGGPARLNARLNNLEEAQKALKTYLSVKRPLNIRKSVRAYFKGPTRNKYGLPKTSVFGRPNCAGSPDGFVSAG